MSNSLSRALLGTAAMIVLLVVVLAAVGTPERWPSVEQPPRQGEAVDPARYAQGQPIHSPERLTTGARAAEHAARPEQVVPLRCLVRLGGQRRTSTK